MGVVRHADAGYPDAISTARRSRSTHPDAGDETMMAPHAGLERRVLAALDASPARIPVVHRRLRHRPHHAAARAGRSPGPRRSASTSTSSAPRARPSASQQAVTASSPFTVTARARPRRRSGHVRARRLRSHARRSSTARARRRRARDVPARRSARAAHVRELPRPAPRAARAAAGAGGERQPLRADQPLRRARARLLRDGPRASK